MTLPATMRVIEISEHGGPDVLRLAERPVPQPGPGQILIRQRAAGVNRPDISQRQGSYGPPPGASDLPGLEGAGEVAAIGAGVRRWAVGDAVVALLPGGGYAEYALTHADHALPLPAGMGWAEAGGICETFFTVWTNVFMRGGLKGGERFLVHGGSSGIGTTAIQLARAFGAEVWTTAGSAEKCAACEKLGAHRALNYREADFVEELRAAGGADVILDMVGGDYFGRNIRSLAPDGRLVQIAMLQGAVTEINLAQIMMGRLTVTGSTLRPQSDAAKAAIAAGLAEKVWPLIAAGQVGPILDTTYPLAEAAEAHRHLESSRHIGKIVLTID